jgi:hypothetical protein
VINEQKLEIKYILGIETEIEENSTNLSAWDEVD